MKYMIKADIKGIDAYGVIDMIQEWGEEAVLRHLLQRYEHRDSELLDIRPWTDFEEVYGEHAEYVLACRRTEGQVMLVKVVSESSHTPGPWLSIEPDPDTYGSYRLHPAAEDQYSSECEAEYRIAAAQDTGNGRLMAAASNAFMKAAKAFGVDAIVLAEAFERADLGGIGELLASFTKRKNEEACHV